MDLSISGCCFDAHASFEGGPPFWRMLLGGLYQQRGVVVFIVLFPHDYLRSPKHFGGFCVALSLHLALCEGCKTEAKRQKQQESTRRHAEMV
jgi:hypothetical protein